MIIFPTFLVFVDLIIPTYQDGFLKDNVVVFPY